MSENTEQTNQPTISKDHHDGLELGNYQDATGSPIIAWNIRLLAQVLSADKSARKPDADLDDALAVSLISLAGIAPQDTLEGMFAAQLVAAHNAAMDCFGVAAVHEQGAAARRDNLQMAIKLSRTSAILLDTLNKHRGKGQQKVTVEHVHVHAGGQAVVGNIEPRGGGDATKEMEQPHAK